jgi:hypothetical protein
MRFFPELPPSGGSVGPIGTDLEGLAGSTPDWTPYWAVGDVPGAFRTTAFTRQMLDDGSASSARTTLGVVIGTDVAAQSHGHVAADVSDFAESVDDRVAALVVPETGVTATYNDGANTLTLGFGLENLTADPVSPATGRIWLRTDL